MLNKSDIDKNFTSVYDQFIFDFDKRHSATDSQLREAEKHQRIAALRDKKQQNNNLSDQKKTAL